jgi:hypothetical protein
MTPLLACVLALGPQQLQVSPVPAVAGDPISVRAHRDGQPLVGVAIELVGPSGERRPAGATGLDGKVVLAVDAPGDHVVEAVIDGVLTLAPFSVRPARRRWLLAAGAVPLGLALLYWNVSRARGRRAP